MQTLSSLLLGSGRVYLGQSRETSAMTTQSEGVSGSPSSPWGPIAVLVTQWSVVIYRPASNTKALQITSQLAALAAGHLCISSLTMESSGSGFTHCGMIRGLEGGGGRKRIRGGGKERGGGIKRVSERMAREIDSE